jgi:hypothetical protein
VNPAKFDRDLLPIAVRAPLWDATTFVDTVRDRYDVHPWTVSRWLWSAHARGLIEDRGRNYASFQIKKADSARRLRELGFRDEPD